MVILGALKCQLLINFFKTKVLITQNKSFHRKNIRRRGRKLGKLFSSHLPLKNSACLSLQTVKSDVLFLPCVRSTSSSQLFHYFIVILPIFFLVRLAKLLGGKKLIENLRTKEHFFHSLCVLLNRNAVRRLRANVQCRLSSYL